MKKLFFGCLTLALLAGCASPATPTAVEPVDGAPEITAAAEVQPASGGSITRALTAEPTSLDPLGPVGSGQSAVLPFLFDTLIYRDQDNTLYPYLATEWTLAPDGKSIFFMLRDDVVFHDGTPLNAEAVRFTFQRLIDQGAKSPLASSLADVSSIEVVNDLAVQFNFNHPTTTFLSSLTTAYAGIVSPGAVEASGDAFAQKPVGSGPFMLQSWQPGVSLTLARNPAYHWGPALFARQGAPLIDQVVIQIIPDAAMQLTAFQAGEADILFINSPAHIARLRQDPNAKLYEATLNSLVYLGFNCQKAPFDNPQVRQAVAAAIDKDALVRAALGGVGQPAFSPLAPTLPGFDAALAGEEITNDPQRVARALENAGYTRAGDAPWQDAAGQPLTIELLASTRAPNETLATVLQDQLKQAGIPVAIRLLESAAASEAANQGDYQVMLWRYDWNDADVLSVYLSSARIGRTNRSFYANPALDELLAQASAEQDPAARNEHYRQAQSLLMQDLPWIPLYTPKDVIAYRGSIEGIQFGPMGRLYLNDAVVK